MHACIPHWATFDPPDTFSLWRLVQVGPIWVTRKVRKQKLADQLRENHLWEVSQCEPVETDEDGVPIPQDDSPKRDDTDVEKLSPPPAAPKSSLVSRFKGMFQRSTKPDAAPSALAKQSGPPHDLNPKRVKTKEELARDAKRKLRRKRDKAVIDAQENVFTEDQDPPPTPKTEPTKREPLGQVGLRPAQGYSCDMREGWRELRVYISANSAELFAEIDALLNLLLHELRPFMEARRLKLVPLFFPEDDGQGDGITTGGHGRMSVVGRLREVQRCHVVCLLQGGQYGKRVLNLLDHLEGTPEAAGVEREGSEAGDDTARRRELERKQEEAERARERELRALYQGDQSLEWLLDYSTRTRQASVQEYEAAMVLPELRAVRRRTTQSQRREHSMAPRALAEADGADEDQLVLLMQIDPERQRAVSRPQGAEEGERGEQENGQGEEKGNVDDGEDGLAGGQPISTLAEPNKSPIEAQQETLRERSKRASDTMASVLSFSRFNTRVAGDSVAVDVRLAELRRFVLEGLQRFVEDTFCPDDGACVFRVRVRVCCRNRARASASVPFHGCGLACIDTHLNLDLNGRTTEAATEGCSHRRDEAGAIFAGTPTPIYQRSCVPEASPAALTRILQPHLVLPSTFGMRSERFREDRADASISFVLSGLVGTVWGR